MFKIKKKDDTENVAVDQSEQQEVVEEQTDTFQIKLNEDVVESDTSKTKKKSMFGKKNKSKNNNENGETQKTVIKWGPNRVLQCFAYFAIMLIAIAMILRLIFKTANPSIMVYMQGIGEVLAYIVCIWLSFYFTLKRGNVWWLVGWIVATVVLVIFYIFSVVNI